MRLGGIAISIPISIPISISISILTNGWRSVRVGDECLSVICERFLTVDADPGGEHLSIACRRVCPPLRAHILLRAGEWHGCPPRVRGRAESGTKDRPQNPVDLRNGPLDVGSCEKMCQREGAGDGASVAHGWVPGDDCHGRRRRCMMCPSESIGKCPPGGSLPRGQGPRRRLRAAPPPSAPGRRAARRLRPGQANRGQRASRRNSPCPISPARPTA
jgi:hypothetical protein